MLWAATAESYEKATNFYECFSQFKLNIADCLKTEDENGSCIANQKGLNKECLERVTEIKKDETTPGETCKAGEFVEGKECK